MENNTRLQQITTAIASDKRWKMIDAIEEFSGDEYETTQSVFKLSRQSKKEVRNTLLDVFNYFLKNGNDE